MLKPTGYSIITDPDAPRPIEHDTFTCNHCRAITFTKAGHGVLTCAVIGPGGVVAMKEVHKCRNCMQEICPRCEGKPCVHWEKAMEEEEAAARRLILP